MKDYQYFLLGKDIYSLTHY